MVVSVSVYKLASNQNSSSKHDHSASIVRDRCVREVCSAHVHDTSDYQICRLYQCRLQRKMVLFGKLPHHPLPSIARLVASCYYRGFGLCLGWISTHVASLSLRPLVCFSTACVTVVLYAVLRAREPLLFMLFKLWWCGILFQEAFFSGSAIADCQGEESCQVSYLTIYYHHQ